MLAIPLRAAGLLAVCCCACRSAAGSGDPPASSEPAGARAGALLRTPHYHLVASFPEDCAPPSPALASVATRRVGVELSVEPTGDVQVPANPYYARLVDAEQNVYEATLGGCGAPLAPALPQPGQAARGWVVFELPRAARPVTLLYAPELLGRTKTELAIDLRR